MAEYEKGSEAKEVPLILILAAAKWYRQVLGDKEFSSGHPSMQALNPIVYEVFLDYAR